MIAAGCAPEKRRRVESMHTPDALFAGRRNRTKEPSLQTLPGRHSLMRVSAAICSYLCSILDGDSGPGSPIVASWFKSLPVRSARDVVAGTGARRTTPRQRRRPSARSASLRPSRNRPTETGGKLSSGQRNSGGRRIHNYSGDRTRLPRGAVSCPAPSSCCIYIMHDREK